MNDFSLQVFENEKFSDLHYIVKDCEPWFLAKDIAEILGYNKTSNMVRILDERDILKVEPNKLKNIGMNSLGDVGSISEPGSISKFTSKSVFLINESGLYNAIFSSKKPNAKEFKYWVTSEVLPSIRRTGSYEISPIPQDKLSSDPFYVSTQQSIMALQRAMQLKYQQDKLKEEQERQKKELEKQEQRQAFQGLELVRQQKQLKELKESVEYQEDSMNYYTVAAYSSNLGLKLNLKQLNRCGRLAAKLSRRLNYKFFKIPHDKFGTVNKYHVEVLEEVFDLINPTNNQEYFDF